MHTIRRKKQLWKKLKQDDSRTNREEYYREEKSVKKRIRNAKRSFEKKLASMEARRMVSKKGSFTHMLSREQRLNPP